MKAPNISVQFVLPGSIAEEVGIEKGDCLISINEQKPRDLIDYRYLCAEETLEVEIQKNNGEIWICDIEKDYDQELGLGFAGDTFDGIRNCANKCIFCFVDQMPEGMRESLYVKDDDYRLSFLHGNFITLTNLTESDLNRILELRLSPLYISVHTTNPILREQMLGNKRARNLKKQLTLLAGAGIEMHTQIVLCPGLNDGEELKTSIADLAALFPGVKSIAIVPVGLTGFRSGLASLHKYRPEEAGAMIELIHNYQRDFCRRFSTPLVYLADEFYVMAGREVPEAENYGGYPQLENGVGLIRLFYDSFKEEEPRIPTALLKEKRVAVVTGTSGEHVLKPIVNRLNKIEGLSVELVAADNRFFGGDVTVAGLLTGEDLIRVLKDKAGYDLILIPSVMCKREESVFLDGRTPLDIEHDLGISVRVVDINEGAENLIDIILE